MSVESRLADVEESLRLLRDANRLQGRRFSAEAPTDDYLIGWDNTAKKWEPKGRALVRKTANQTLNTSIALQDDDDLKIALAASETWFFEAFIVCGGPSAADIKFAFTVPAGATLLWGASGPLLGAGGTHAEFDVATSSAAVVSYDTETGTDRSVHIRGTAINSTTAGDLQLQWAQNLSDGTNITVFANSWLKGQRL